MLSLESDWLTDAVGSRFLPGYLTLPGSGLAEALKAQLRANSGGVLAILGHNENGYYGSTEKILISDVLTAAKQSDVTVLHLSCKSSTFASLGVTESDTTLLFAKRLISSSKTHSINEFSNALHLQPSESILTLDSKLTKAARFPGRTQNEHPRSRYVPVLAILSFSSAKCAS